MTGVAIRSSRRPIIVLVALAAALTLTASMLEARDLAAPIADSSGISFQTDVEGAGWRLTISGPDGFYASRDFRNETPRLGFGEDGPWSEGEYTWELRSLGPDGGRQSGHFRVQGAALLLPDPTRSEPARARSRPLETNLAPEPAGAVTIHPNDTIIQGDLCAGFDCLTDEVFGFTVLKLKDNNNRIEFLDTSTSTFPSRDWQIVLNDSANAGANYFAIQDTDGGAIPFRIEAGAAADSLRIDDMGRVGLGTAVPSSQLHVAGDAFIDGDIEITSSRDAKEHFRPVDAEAILADVASLPIVEWSYRGDGQKSRHLGPFAEDFARAFALGADERRLNPLDVAGVALVAIQGLERQLAVQRQEIERLRTEREAIAARLSALEASIQASY